MSTLHMQTETVHSAARQMMRISEQSSAEIRALARAAKSLEAAWQSKSSDDFLLDSTEVIRRLQMQYELLMVLAERVEREASEWEQVDRNGTAAFHTSKSPFLGALPVSVIAGGPGNASSFSSAILPLFTGLSIGSLLDGLPDWLKPLLARFFPPAQIPSPISDGSIPPQRPPSTTFGELLKENPSDGAPAVIFPAAESPPEQPDAPAGNNGYDVYYDIPIKSQGELYGSAACLPTSLSMITEYYHAKDPANQAISPEGLRDMLDPGDGTWGRGVTFDRLNDDLNELGYKNIPPFQSDMDGLKSELAEGPVVANIGVRLLSQPARALDGPGATNHAVVIRAISADGVLINDPWSGSEIRLTNDEFSSMWSRGDHWLQTVRP